MTFIRRCRDFGFPLEQVRALVALVQDADRSRLETRDLAREHLTALRARLHGLKEPERSLTRFVRVSESDRIDGPDPARTILEDPSLPAANGRSQQDARQSPLRQGVQAASVRGAGPTSTGATRASAIAGGAGVSAAHRSSTPTIRLDSGSGQLVVELLLRVIGEAGATLLAVTHDPALVAVIGQACHVDHGRLERVR